MSTRKNHTRHKSKFSEAEKTVLAILQSALGSEPTRQEVQRWFRENTGKKWADQWIVKNGYILKPEGKKLLCVLDLKKMPKTPYAPARTTA